MPGIVNTVMTVFDADSGPYEAACARVVSASVTIGTVAVEGIAALGTAILGLAAYASNASADIEALKVGLVAITGDAAAAGREFETLKKLSRLPGLRIEEITKAAAGLQAAGLGFKETTDILKGFGNAVASVGGGPEQLASIALAIEHISASGKVLGRDIRMLQRNAPQTFGLMKQIFGTADTQELQKMGITSEIFIKKLTDAVLGLNQVGSFMKNTWINFWSAIKFGAAEAGDQINAVLGPAIQKVTNALYNLKDSGVITKITKGFIDLFNVNGADSILVRGLAAIIATLEIIPGVLRKVISAFNSALDFVLSNIKGIVHGIVYMVAILNASKIVAAIGLIVEAFVAVREAIKSATIMDIIFDAIASKGLSLVADLTAGLIAAGVAFLALKGLDAMFDSGKKTFTDAFSPIMDEWQKNFNDAMNMMNGPGNNSVNPQDENTNPDSDDSEKVSTQYLSQIAKNTKGMKDDLHQFVLGGGEMAKLGVTPVELNAFHRASRSRRLRHGSNIDLSEMLDERAMDMAQDIIEHYFRMQPAHAR